MKYNGFMPNEMNTKVEDSPLLNKRSLTMLLLGLGVIGFLTVYYMGQAYFVRHSHSPQVHQGIIDLTQWDFNENGTVKLNGSWQFYWNQLLTSDQAGEPTGYLNVPGQWNRDRFPAKSAATYRLLVKVKPSSMMYGIRISNVQMSSAVYVNGVELGGSGRPALSKDGYTPENTPYTLYFPIQGDTAEIVLHAANFDFINGGVTYPIHFGSMNAIKNLDKTITGLDIIVVVALCMLGIYHLGVFLKRRQETSLLYFGLYCIFAAFAYACLSDKLFMQFFDGLPFELSYKFQYFGLYGSMIIITLFIRSICSEIVPAWFFKAVFAAFGSFLLFTLIFSFDVYSHITFIFSALQVVAYLSVIWMISVSRENRYGDFSRQSMIFLILAFYALLICLIDNTLYILGRLPNNILGSISMMVFAILVSLMLSFRFSDAYRTIETMSAKLVESDRLKDEFLLNTSHELQTPLNGILNISQSMLKGATGPVSEKQWVNLTTIQEAARRLSALVGDILDLERIKRNDLLLQPSAVDVRVTVSVVLEVLDHLAADKELRLINRIPHDLPPVHADENRLRQVLYNLIGNAIKFTEQGTVDIMAERIGNRIKVAVQDTGIGIVRSEWQRIFQSFTQADGGEPQRYGGIGLGLSISRQLVELMKGEIYIEASEVGQGTRVALILPVSEGVPANRHMNNEREAFVQLAKKEANHGQESYPGGFTLLAVDDEPANLQVLMNLFADEEYHLLTASNGREALRILQANRGIDLVLLDVMMPQLSGYEVCREIRSKFTLFDMPVVMMTVRNTPHDIAAGFAAGANDFIVKPFNAWEVQARVKTLLELKKSVRHALDAEMAFLQAQIKPHFLFNALNAIVSICYTDSSRAAQLIGHLSYYLRRNFDLPSTEQFVSLRDEIKLVESYVEIEKARFDERVAVEYEVDETLLGTGILPLTIQPLVENAIRHGIMKRKHGGTVRLIVKGVTGEQVLNQEPETVCVEVWDNGMGIVPQQLTALLDHTRERSTGGVGLINIHRRLLNMLGEGLRIESVEGEWTSVRFQVKASRHADSI